MEETQLLRAVILFAAVSGMAGPLLAEDAEGSGPRFAPGATGSLSVPVDRLMNRAEEDAGWLRSRLSPQEPDTEALDGFDFEVARDRALKNPRVRALLGADPEEGAVRGSGPEDDRYGNARVFLFASFSMPEVALKAMMVEAKARAVPILFRGFVNNSVYDTRAALERVFGGADESAGFMLDPTFFARFDVTTVPQVIAVSETLDVCETSGCEDDPQPPHDRVRGNVPLDYALRLIADEGDVAAPVARALLGE